MCKTRLDSHGMILNGFWKNYFSKYVNGTQDPHPQFMANAILNFHFFGTLPLKTLTFCSNPLPPGPLAYDNILQIQRFKIDEIWNLQVL